ncbi:hypothetical protein MRX96_029629 [Rhipicephalus microplus]
MARANVPRFFLVRFLGLWSLQLLEPSGPCIPFPPSAVRPWPDATPLLPEDHAVGLFWSSNQPFFGASRSAHFVPSRRPYQQASWLSVGHFNTGTSPAHSTHAWDLVKKQAQSKTPFSGSGSMLTMARANVPRFFLVQFLGLWSLQLLEPSGPRTPFSPSAVRPWPDATPLLPEDHAACLNVHTLEVAYYALMNDHPDFLEAPEIHRYVVKAFLMRLF